LSDDEQYRPGSVEDFDRLYRATYPRLQRTVYAVLGDQAAAEDCVQDAFVRAFNAWPPFKPERPAEAWLHQIAINGAISYRRKMRLREVGELLRRLGGPPAERDPADSALAGEVVSALARLPVKLAATFGLRLAQARERLARDLGPGWSLPTSRGSSVAMDKSRDA